MVLNIIIRNRFRIEICELSFYKDFLKSFSNAEPVKTEISLSDIKVWLEKVKNEEIYFESTYDEVYNHSGWGIDYEVNYTDPFHIGDELKKICHVTEELLLNKAYGQSYKLLRILSNMLFLVRRLDSGDEQEFDLKELVSEKIVDIDLHKMIVNLLYSCYQIKSGKQREEVFFEYLNRKIDCEIYSS